jgi:predicted dithiol-disulfide oxidoreductase (DUF899 family)
MQHEIVCHEEWLAARKALLVSEKKLAEARAGVIDQRRALPWTRVEKPYGFDAPAGRQTLSDLFDGRSRLTPITSCSRRNGKMVARLPRLADHFDGMHDHLLRRDATFAAICASSTRSSSSAAQGLAFRGFRRS